MGTVEAAKMGKMSKGRGRRRQSKNLDAWTVPGLSRPILRGPYRYRPLETSKDEIRLLRLPRTRKLGSSGLDKDPIEASLVHVSLDDQLKYEALSYRWGDDNTTDRIVIDGYSVKISKTLGSAVRELRGSKETKLVWVDALCINQMADEERNEQVSKMRKIYSHAANVVVWLGEGTLASSLGLSLIQDLYDRLDVGGAHLVDTLLDDQRRPHWAGLLEILRREYWKRIWIIQEVNSARRVTLRCGSDALNWEHFVAVQSHFVSMLSSGDKTFSASGQLGIRDKFRQSGPRILSLPTRDLNATGLPSLSDVMTFFGNRMAANHRDFVYALLGLTSARDDPLMVIDYSQSVRQVYMGVVEYLLSREHKLDIICARMASGPSENIHDLPSWTPDWSNHYFVRRINTRREDGVQFCASKNRAAKAALVKEHGLLRADGFRVSVVKDLGHSTHARWIEDFEHVIPSVLQWYSLSLSFDTKGNDEAFTRTLLLDGFTEKHAGRKGISDLLKVILGAFPKFSQQLRLPEHIPERLLLLTENYPESDVFIESWVRRICHCLSGRRMFVTEQGELGLCPESYQDGDVLVILLGCSVPLLLRPQDGYYTLAGDVYLYGYMYGRAINELDEGKFKLETFEIR